MFHRSSMEALATFVDFLIYKGRDNGSFMTPE